MGGVTSDSNVTVNTDIDRTVTVSPDRSATVDLSVDGDFADAEAAAGATLGDAGDGDGGTGGGELVEAFLIDDFLSDQAVVATGPTSAGDAMDLAPAESDFADGTERDVTAANDGDTPMDGDGQFDSGGGNDLGRFSTGSGVDTTFALLYDPAAPADILAGNDAEGAAIRFENSGSDLGETLSVTITDDDGTSAAQQIEIPPGSSTPFPPENSFDIPLEDFADAALGGAGTLDFAAVDSIELELVSEPEADTSIARLGVVVPEEEPRNVLAETFTAAQTEPGLAASCSQAFAAVEGYSTPLDATEGTGLG